MFWDMAAATRCLPGKDMAGDSRPPATQPLPSPLPSCMSLLLPPCHPPQHLSPQRGGGGWVGGQPGLSPPHLTSALSDQLSSTSPASPVLTFPFSRSGLTCLPALAHRLPRWPCGPSLCTQAPHGHPAHIAPATGQDSAVPGSCRSLCLGHLRGPLPPTPQVLSLKARPLLEVC